MGKAVTAKIWVQRLTLCAGLVAVLVWLVGKQFGSFKLPDNAVAGVANLELVLGIVAGIVATLAVYEMIRTFDIPGEQEKTKHIKDVVDRIEKQLKQKKLEMVRAPSTEEEYIELWSGFTGHYFAYNPAYRIERRAGIDADEITNNVFVPRYRDPRFLKAYYLFLTQDKAGQDDLARFKELMAGLDKQCPDIARKLEVKQLRLPSSSDGELYFGTKNGTRQAIVEPRQSAFTDGRGTPHYYVLVVDEELTERLEKKFKKDWDRGEPVSIFKRVGEDTADEKPTLPKNKGLQPEELDGDSGS